MCLYEHYGVCVVVCSVRQKERKEKKGMKISRHGEEGGWEGK